MGVTNNRSFAARVDDLSVSVVAQQPSVMAAAALVSKAYDFNNHPYFKWVLNPETTLEEYRETQIPFRYAIEHFSRAMSAVLAQIPAMEDRMEVFENVAEEHGEGKLEDSHRDSFMAFLRSIGVPDDEMNVECPIRMSGFYEGLLNYALTKPYEISAALMGTIEYLHCNIAELQARALHDRFWGDYESQYHYRLHKEIDVGHAKDLYSVCETNWERGGDLTRERIAYSMLLAAHYLWRLFDDMLPVEMIQPSAVDPTTNFLATKEIENSRRVQCKLNAIITLENGNEHRATIPFFGQFGCGLNTTFSAAINTAISSIKILTDEGECLIDIPACVRANTSSDSLCGVIAEFRFNDTEQRSKLHNVVRTVEETMRNATAA